MDITARFHYEAPEVKVVETHFEGMICQSDNMIPDRNDYDLIDTNPFEDTPLLP